MNNAAHFMFVSNMAACAEKDAAVSEKCAAQVRALREAVKAEDENLQLSVMYAARKSRLPTTTRWGARLTPPGRRHSWTLTRAGCISCSGCPPCLPRAGAVWYTVGHEYEPFS